MNSYILRFFSYHQPRRIRVIENLLTNRLTVSNLFWGQQYGLLQWLGADRQLHRAEYDATIKALAEERLITVDDEQQARLTVKGVQQQEGEAHYQPHFLDWYWLTNTNQLGQRLLLGMQVVSEYAYHNAKYAPVTVGYGHMLAVKRWFHQADHHQLVAAVYHDLDQLTTGLESADSRLAALLVDGLVGHGLPAWTTDQLAEQLQFSTADMLVLNHDLLLGVAAYCQHVPGPLHDLLAPLLNAGPLSRSTAATLGLYQQGEGLKQIAAQRRLKLSTVREHILEVAILCPNQLDWDRLLPAATRTALAKQYPDQDVTSWHFKSVKHDSGDAFFNYRLFQIF
ncbi:MAG: helix-turn-helix domain-containing protein, partial [Limosilactobacillus sp.]